MVQQQYGQPQYPQYPQYGVQPQPYYPQPQQYPPMQQGIPPMPPPPGQAPAPAPTMPDMVKWNGLAQGGFQKTPVVKFIGRFDSKDYDLQNKFGMQIIEHWSQVQVLETTAPYPFATLDVPIKYSDKENSAWGSHVESFKILGLTQNAQTLEEAERELIGKYFEMHCEKKTYGDDKDGKPMVGDIWVAKRIVQAMGAPAPGMPPQQAIPQYQPNVQPQPQPQQYQQPAPAPVQTQPAPAPAPAPAPVQASVGGGQAIFNATLDASDTPNLRAKKLIHNKALNEFLGVALTDPVIKSDQALVNSIFNQSFMLGLKTSGQVQEVNGKYIVVA